jgi:membrane protease YdiL (CAAX protease family)
MFDIINLAVFTPLIIAFVFFNNCLKFIPLILVFTSIISAFTFGMIDFLSSLVLISHGVVCYLFSTTKMKWLRHVSTILIFILTVVLMGHMLSGINNPKIIDNYYLSGDAVPFSKYLNIDKAIAGIFLLLYVVPRPKKVSFDNRVVAVLVTTLFISLILLFSTYLGVIRIDLKISMLVVPWFITNLFFTCYAEEAFFRGYIQEFISKLFLGYKFNFIIAILISGVLFGLVHFSAGLIYTSFATIMGCSLAYIYYKTKNIYWPVFAHFMFNLIHFVLFTYPYLK